MLILSKIRKYFDNAVSSVPVHIKIIGIGLLPILILGFALNYWIVTGLSDWLSYILTDARVEAAMNAGARSVLFVTILGAIMSISVSLFLSHILSRPILALRKMAQQVAAGNFNARAKVWAKDEIGDLAASINIMTDKLVSTQENLTRTNRSLDAINQVALAADKEGDIHDALYIMLENMLSIMKLETGWVYLHDPSRQASHLASWYGVSDRLAKCLLHPSDDLLCACQNTLITENQTAKIGSCSRLENCEYFDLGNAHISVPLVARDQKFGVINLLCPEDAIISDADIELLDSIGVQVSEIVASAWLRIKLAEKEASRQILLESLVQAQEEERGRLARELHDGAGQMLTSLLVRLKTLEKKISLSQPDLKNDFENMQEVVSETIEQVRDLSYQLRPPALDEFGLSMALDVLVQDLGQEVDLTTNCVCGLVNHDLPEEIEVVLYRIAQEGITNIVRHAKAKLVKLEVQLKEKGVFMTIDDDGEGFDPKKVSIGKDKRHLGLLSIRERAEMLGGRLDVFTSLGEGTSIQVFIPLPEGLS